MTKTLKIRLLVLVVLFLGATFSFYAARREERNNVLTVVFLNVSQGDAIYIEAPNGNQMLIDGGPSKAILRELSKVMPFYDRSIDVVLATHADQDHVGGLPDVIGKYKVGLFLESGVEGESSSYKEVKLKIENLNIERLEVKGGMSVDLGNGAILQILSPANIFDGMETNKASVVVRLIYGENEFLLTGDSPTSIENYLVSLGGLESDVLKTGHHGSKTSTSQAFVSAVSPEYAVISVGKDNKYGHPNQETLDTLNNFGAKILRTDLLGRVIFKSDGINIKIK